MRVSDRSPARLVLAFALVLTGLLLALEAKGQALQDFNVGWQAAAYPDFYAAVSKSLFEKVGLKPKLIKFTSGPPMIAALRSSDIDIAVMGQPPFLAAVDQGVDVKVFLVEGYMAKSEWLVVPKASPITKCGDLKGKKIAVTMGSSSHFGVLKCLSSAKLSVADLTILHLDTFAQVPAFIRGDVDGVWAWPPWWLRLVGEGGKAVVSNADVGADGGAVWVGRTAWLKERPELVQRFIKVLQMGQADLAKDRKEVEKIMADHMGITPAIASQVLDTVEYLSPAQQISGHKMSMGKSVVQKDEGLARNFRELVDFLVTERRIKSRPQPEALIDSSHIEAYVKQQVVPR